MSQEQVSQYQEDYTIEVSKEEIWECEVHASGYYHFNPGDGCNNPPEGFYTSTNIDMTCAFKTHEDGTQEEASEEKLKELVNLINVEDFLEQ